MTSTAISAQGSTLQIGTGSGAAKSVTGVVVGSPTILTSTAHGLSNGDNVALASFTGADAALLNGQNFVVKNVTANTFAIDVNTLGKTITVSSSTATPVALTKIKNLKSFSGFDGSASEEDVTDLDSTAKEFKLGLVDNGSLSLEINKDTSDAGQLACEAARVSGALKPFKLTLPNGVVASFSAYVKKFSISGGVDASIKSPLDLRISGPVIWA